MVKDRIPVVLHAHFYQPPRDNPWTESVEREFSAAPFHDWNERIESECYGANAHARVFGGDGRIVDVVNNYAHLNFNIGPTLFSWLEAQAPYTYARILEADRISLALNDGHGGAIAQAYSHAILPLCNERDRDTQIRWGIADFEYRFGRAPEAMWLPETACDLPTADALARHGMRYVILSPHQAKRVKPASSEDWVDVSDGSIDPRRPYRLALPEGRSIVCYFYDGPIAHAMSFEAMLDTSRGIAWRLRQAAANNGQEQLLHVATDGETYGHHKRFADRSLAFFIQQEAENHGLRLTNYGAHLDRVSVDNDVELKDGEGTAWSCAHGLGRWIRDCGCNAGREPGYRQTWRGPLRKALDGLRDDAAELFEEVAGDALKDVWAARNDYVDVILHNTGRARDAFLQRHVRKELSGKERVRVLGMLEAQRMTQLMYASCGWFFDDLAGLETTQILKYAAMAGHHMETASDRPCQAALLERLAEARSNDPDQGNGADVFQRHVAPWEISPKRRVARFASSDLFGDLTSFERDPAFEIESLERTMFAHATHHMVVGRARVTRTRTERTTDIIYGAAALPERDMHCGVVESSNVEHYAALVEDARAVFEQPSTPQVIRLIDRHLGPEFFSVRELSDAGRTEFIEHMVTDLVDRLGATYGYLYDEHRRTIEAFERAGADVPRELRMVAEYTLARRLDAAVLEADAPADPTLVRTAKDISRQAKELSIKLVAPRSAHRLEELLSQAADRLEADPDERATQRTVDLLALTEVLGVEVGLDRLQDVVFDLLRREAASNWPKRLRSELAKRVGVAEPGPDHP
jgi:alpha-amylase/alpha-mannosidase (GH57 family)